MISLKFPAAIISAAIICLFHGPPGVVSQHVSSFVDPNIVFQENFQGWGTSLAWWGDVVGGMDSEIVDHVVDALFSPSKLNLNIARYVIGGTTPDNHTCGEYRDGAASETFKDGLDEPFNWDRDLRQRRIIQMAKASGANIFEAFSNTPPQWMTISGCSKGRLAPPLNSNFDAANAPIFADYATEVIKHFNDILNITFTTYSPFNEPYGLHGIGGWVGPTQSQEGCNMGRPTMVEVIKSVHSAILEKNLSFVKIAISDETQVNTQLQSYDYFDEAGVSDLFQQVNVHGYWDDFEVSRKDLLSARSSQRGHELWMDEMGWGGSPIDNMEQGLNIANRIVLDLRTMVPSAWVYWQAVENVGAWGLIEVPFHNTSLEDVKFNSGYYALEQFSHHIRQGYKLIQVSDWNSIAALSENLQKLVVVTVNPGETNVTHEFDLSLFGTVGAVSLSRTSPIEQHTNLPPPALDAQNRIQIDCPPQSVSTLEISGVSLADMANLIANGNFEQVTQRDETVQPESWVLENSRSVDGVTQDNAWRGNHSGVLEVGPFRSSALLQNVTLSGDSSKSCSMYLTARCLSARAGTKLGVSIGEDTVAEVDIERNSVYGSYGISFSARGGETVQVSFSNRNGALLDGLAKIDEVVLHAKCV